MRGFRIAAARFARSRKAAFSGQGGVVASARWHTAGQPIVYTSQSLSLAALEILVHLKQTDDLQPFRAFVVEIPDDMILVPRSYPTRWATDYKVSRAFGDSWLNAAEKVALRVPSVITPGEWNYLLNPVHPNFSLKWIIAGPTAYTFDARLLNVHRVGH
jgi:RES domain-containing protein